MSFMMDLICYDFMISPAFTLNPSYKYPLIHSNPREDSVDCLLNSHFSLFVGVQFSLSKVIFSLFVGVQFFLSKVFLGTWYAILDNEM